MKRIASLVLAFLMMATLLVGCGGGTNTEKPADDDTAAPAEDGVYTGNWIVAVNTSEGDILYEAVAKFCDLVEEYSNGNITCDLYGGTQLGSGQELLEGCRLYTSGVVHADDIHQLQGISLFVCLNGV